MKTSATPSPLLWVGLSRCSAISAAQALAYKQLLSPAEIARNGRYRFERDRHRDLIARALLRTSLAERFEAEPAELKFEIDAKGKPHLGAWPKAQQQAGREQSGAGGQYSTLCFNLAHSGDWVVLAIAGFRVGIDVEHTVRKNDVLGIARHYFFGAEVEQLFAFPEDQQKERFFDYWTLKEAYMKARGEGISLGLDNFGFSLPTSASATANSNDIRLYTKPCLNDDPAAWQFSCLSPEPDYRLSIAARTEQNYQLECQEVVPLQSRSELGWQLA